ncbi:MAG: ribonuclease Z [Flavobacteriaceae bacterium]
MDAFEQPIKTIPLTLDFLQEKQVLAVENDYIFDALACRVEKEFVTAFAELLTSIESKSHSRVIVVDSAYLDLFPATVVAVPTLGEAHDIIEMERIERDLGF